MGKIDVVVGVERTAKYRPPNGVECDRCGEIVNLLRDDFRGEVARVWDLGWYLDPVTGEAYCSVCRDGQA